MEALIRSLASGKLERVLLSHIREVVLTVLEIRTGSVKQIHREELEDGDKEQPSAFPKIMLKQTDSSIQQLHGVGERTLRRIAAAYRSTGENPIGIDDTEHSEVRTSLLASLF